MGLGFVNVPGNGGGGEGGVLTLNRIYVSKQPNKTAYKAGEVFDPAGMIVKADYSLGGIVIVEGKEVTGYTYPTTGLTVGTTKITISLTEGGTTQTAEVTVSVTKTAVTVPTFTQTPTYTGNVITPVFTNDPGALATKSGDLTGLNAANYSTRFTLNDTDLYEWVGGSTAPVDVAWSIGQATPTFSVNPSSVTLNKSTLTKDCTISTNSTGGITAATSDNKVATCNVSGSIATVSHVNQTSGSATITLTLAATQNYKGATCKITVTASFVSSTLNDNDWATIADVGKAGNGSSYWKIGDTKTVTLSGTVGTLNVSGTYNVFIIEFNYRGDNGVYFQGFKTTGGEYVCLCDDKYGSSAGNTGDKKFAMNHWGTTSGNYNTNYGGWAGCDLRYDILGSTDKQPSGYGSTPTTSRTGYDATSAAKNSPVSNTLMAALPSELRNSLAPWTVYTDNKGGGSDTAGNVTASVDYLPLLDEWEVHGARTYANSASKNYQAQMKFFADSNTKIRKKHDATGTAASWWCRGPSASYATNFCRVGAGGAAYTNASRISYGLAPAFRVAA